MKILKLNEFIKENFTHDTPESYVANALKHLKRKIDKMFEYTEGGEEDVNQNRVLTSDQLEKIDKDKLTFKDLNVYLESSEMSKYPSTHDSLTIKFSDEYNTYALIILIDIEQAIPPKNKKNFSFNDIEWVYIKFKKYDVETFEIIGQIDKNVKMKKINEEFLIALKIELDEKFSDTEEEFEIKT